MAKTQLDTALERLRAKLLDLSHRNRLLNFQEQGAKVVRIIDELPDQVYSHLVDKQASMILEPKEPPADTLADKSEDLDDGKTRHDQQGMLQHALAEAIERVESDSNDDAKEREAEELDLTGDLPEELAEDFVQTWRHRDDRLQTTLTHDQLEGRMRRIHTEYKNFIDSTGANLLFLAIGFLKWHDAQKDPDKARLAPLILIPITLERQLVDLVRGDSGELEEGCNVRTYQYTIRYSGDEVVSNLALAMKLKNDFGFALPEFGTGDLATPEEFLRRMSRSVARWRIPTKEPWRVVRQMRLAFFTFSKDVMYRDLDPNNWQGDALRQHPAVQSTLVGGPKQPSTEISDEEVEELHRDASFPTVLDADASQMKVIQAALGGANLVVQGPPGTGKSQTITNLIAAALAQGKRVLFMAEKLAALEVVRERLRQVGLSAYCLELHSKRSSSKEVLAQIRERLEHRPQKARNVGGVDLGSINRSRDRLKTHCELMGTTVDGVGLTISELFWQAEVSRERLRAKVGGLQCEVEIPGLTAPPAESWESLPNHGKLDDLKEYLDAVRKHWHEDIHRRGRVWNGFIVKHLTDQEVDAIEQVIMTSCGILEQLLASQRQNSEVPGLAEMAPSQVFQVDDALSSIKPPPQDFNEYITRNLAENLDCLADYQEYIADALLIQQHGGTDAAVLAAETRLKNEDLDAAIQELQRLLPETSKYGSTLEESRVISADLSDALAALLKAASLARELLPILQLEISLTSITDHQRLAEWAEWLAQLTPEVVEATEPCHAVANIHQYRHEAETAQAELEKMRGDLNKVFVIGDAPAPKQLKEIRLILREADGIWYGKWWPFGRFCAARKAAYRFKRKGVSIWSATFLDQLEALEGLPQREAGFREHRELQRALGGVFRGVDTNWSLLTACIDLGCKIRDMVGTQRIAGKFISSLKSLHDRREELLDLAGEIRVATTRSAALLGARLAMLGQTFCNLPVTELREELERRHQFLERAVACIAASNPGSQKRYEEILTQVRLARQLRDARSRISSFVADGNRLGVKQVDIRSEDVDRIAKTAAWAEQLIHENRLTSEIKRWLLQADTATRHAKLSAVLKTMRQHLDHYANTIEKLGSFGEAVPGLPFSSKTVDRKLGLIHDALLAALAEIDILMRWGDYQSCRDWLSKNRHDHLLEFAEQNHLSGEILGQLAEAAFFKEWQSWTLKKHPQLYQFQRIQHEIARTSFCESDKKLPLLFRNEVEARVYCDHRTIDRGISTGRVSEYTEMTLISNEVSKQRRLAPVRELIRRSANSLQKLMPCWMMGPSSVAQFLPPDVVRFDLLVIDEASQIRPEDALGSLARADQVVVVGDSNQMPPSDFFSTNPHDDDDDQACGAEEIGSILERLRDFFAERSLIWHYRSQHQSLILFSNERYYEKKLIVPPSVHRDHPKLGVKWHHLAEARYHAGINEQEAYAVIQLLIEHVRANIRLPEETRETIGVVAMNVKQQGLIQEMLDRYLAEDAVFAENFSTFERACPVFVKNLESVQGDERDVIIISFTFGPDLATNRVFQRFGPIMREGGWRRLNVLFTRARRRIHACSSMRYTDITISEERRGNGAADLRAYLEYAEKGLLPDYGETTGKGPDSPFEEAVARVISDLGYDAHYQVGVDGFQIDIGVVHPDSPGSYLCGIECDGAKYHSHPVARDRDRLREEILRARGREIYRIWSTDWYRNRTTEVERLQKELQRLRSHRRGKSEMNAKL